MDYEEDSIYISPEPQVASTPAKRRPVARMHASRVSKARNSLKVKNKRMVSRPRLLERHQATVSNTELRAGWSVENMCGKCPPYNDNGGWMEDPRNQRIYAYGGSAPGDESEIPSSDFYVCDTTTMTWKNITNSLKFRAPYSPFSREERRRQATPLPQLTEPGCTMLSIDNSNFIFIFGGYDIDKEKASSKIIVVDLDHLEWWYLRLEGGDVEARIAPAIVAVDTKLYIFGGYDDDYSRRLVNSYSVAEFLQDQRWHWTIRDQPYSNIVPQGHSFGKAIPVYNGAKLLLTPGRILRNPIQFKEDNLFYYHIAKKRFQLADITGDFPTDVLWYSIHEYRAPLPELPTSPTCIRVSAPTSVKRGRPRKAPPTSNTLAMTQPTASTSSPSIIICAWIPIPDPEEDDDVGPELWHLLLTPDERIDRLNIAQQVYELDRDFQGFVCVDGKMRLMGHHDERSVEEEKKTWNVFLDVPMPNGK